jgi:Spore Coat Protein U domain
MKKIALIAASVAALASMAPAHAATATGNFTVGLTLISQCRLVAGSPAIAFGNYTAFTGTALTGNTSISFECTRGFTARPTVSFDDGANGTSSATTNGTATGEGVLSGLRYTLSVAAVNVSGTGGTNATAGVGGTGGSDGTPDTYSYTINGTVPAGQAGTCATGGATNCAASHTRVLTITY